MPRPTDPYYTPPRFHAYEFDDSRLAPEQAASGTRWLSGFQGRIGDPAGAVQISWRAPGGGQFSVCTKRAKADESAHDHRLGALFEVTTSQFYEPGPPPRPVVTGWEELQSLADDATRWHESEMVVNHKTVRADGSEIAGCRLGYVVIDDVVLYFVHRRLGPEPVAVRRLPEPAGDYRIDPAAPQTATELGREWEGFFRDRPDLDG